MLAAWRSRNSCVLTVDFTALCGRAASWRYMFTLPLFPKEAGLLSFRLAEAATNAFNPHVSSGWRGPPPNGAAGCNHGWSGVAALRPAAEPVESREM